MMARRLTTLILVAAFLACAVVAADHGAQVEDTDPAAYVPARASSFTDVATSATFYREISWLSDREISTGYAQAGGTRRFEPSAPVLREQMAAFLYRLAGRPDVPNLPTRSPFADVPTSHAFYREMVWLARTGISTGYADPGGTTFRPAAPVLREQMAAFMFRLETWKTGVEPGVETAGGSPFTDVPTSHAFYRQMRWLAAEGITTGYTEGDGSRTFRPGAPVLREQMAAFMFRLSMTPDTVVRVSRHPQAGPADNISDKPAISADGRWVVFQSKASNLAPGTTPGQFEQPKDRIYLQDQQTGAVVLVAAAPDGTPADADSMLPSISADGRYVAYQSFATNLVPGGSAAARAYLWDRTTGATVRVPPTVAPGSGSVSLGLPVVSGDGKHVVFSQSIDGATATLQVWNRVDNTFTHVSTYANNGFFPVPAAVSHDASHVAFISTSTDLVAGDDNGGTDVFLWDANGSTVSLVSAAADGTPGNAYSYDPSISADGSTIAYQTAATDLVADHGGPGRDILVNDVDTGRTYRASSGSSGRFDTGDTTEPALSGDGHTLAWAHRGTGDLDVFQVYVRDLRTGATTVASRGSSGSSFGYPNSGSPAVSGDGTSVAFTSIATNLVEEPQNHGAFNTQIYRWEGAPY